MHCPTKTHWRTVKRILRYLQGYLTSGLVGHLMGMIVGLSMVLSSIMVVTSVVGLPAEYQEIAFATTDWCWSSKLLSSVCVSFSATTFVLFICRSTLCFISSPSTLKLITTLSGNRLFKGSLIIRHVRALEQMADLFAYALGNSRYLTFGLVIRPCSDSRLVAYFDARLGI
ncbi:hypothetical protein V2J09_000089 [Rumex salicifolius]